MKTVAAVVVWSILLTPMLYGQEKKTPAIFTRASGGSIQTKLGAGFVVNKESSLEREWITMHDPAVPADLVGNVGVTTIFEPGRSGGEYHYKAQVNVMPREPLKAIEIRFLGSTCGDGMCGTSASTKLRTYQPESNAPFRRPACLFRERGVTALRVDRVHRARADR